MYLLTLKLKNHLWALKETFWMLLAIIIFITVTVIRKKMYSSDTYYYSPTVYYEVIVNSPNSELEEIEKSINYEFKRYPHIIFFEKLFNVEPSEKPAQTVTCNNVLKCDLSYYPRTLSNKSAGAYIFHLKDRGNPPQKAEQQWPMPRYATHIWGLLQEESPIYCTKYLDEKALNLFNFSSTFSRHSNIPFPLLNMVSLNNITSKLYFVKTKTKNYFLKEISPLLYLQSNCQTTTGRDLYVQKLMKYIPIDSYGKCINNKNLPRAYRTFTYKYLENEDFLHFVARYKFVIAIENSVCDDYVTEKFWRAIHLGVVPIYFGSATIRDWLPNEKSAILVEDYPNPKLLLAHIDNLMHDDDLYEECLEHKTKGIIKNQNLIRELKMRPYQTDFELIKEKLQCLLCEQLHKLKEAPLPTSIVNKTHYCPTPISDLPLNWNLINT